MATLFQDFDGDKLTSLPWYSLDCQCEMAVKGAGPGVTSWISPLRGISVLYDNKSFVFEGCTMTTILKSNRFRQLCFRVEILEKEFIDYLEKLYKKCLVFTENNEGFFPPVRNLLHNNYFFGKCSKTYSFIDVYGNEINRENLVEREITFIPTFQLYSIMHTVRNDFSVINFKLIKAVVL